MRRLIGDSLELLLSIVGLIVILGASWWLDPIGSGRIVEIIALIVTGVHGLIFWTFRRWQHIVAQRKVMQIRHILIDQVINPLGTVETIVSIAPHVGIPQGDVHTTVKANIDKVVLLLRELSMDSIKEWESRYPGQLPKI